MIVLVVRLELLDGKKQDFLDIAQPLIEGSKKEAGNIEYNLYEDLGCQNTVAFIEKWQDQAAIDLHEKTEHFTKNIGKLVALCKNPPIKHVYDIAK